MVCIECQINKDLGLFDLKTTGKQEVGDLCSYHDEIFKVV
jgi:hypothetical protein